MDDNNATNITYTSTDDDGVAVYDPYLVALLPKPMALLSMIGSYVLIREVVADQRLCRGKTVSRTLLMMSVADMFFSFGWFLTTWPAPKELDYIWGNVGNTATCTFQGFIIQLGLMASPLFNASLAFFYLLMVRYNWTDCQLVVVEKWFHALIWFFALSSSIFLIPLGLYNSNWEVCWIDSYPYECLDSWTYGEDSTCTRGDNAWIYGLAFTVFPVWFCILASALMMVMIFSSVRHLENQSRKYASSINVRASLQPRGAETEQQNVYEINRKKSKAVARQAMWYIGAFLLTYSLDLVTGVIYYANRYFNDWLDYFAYMLLPLQGFLNFLVFARTRNQMETPEGRFLRQILFYSCCQKKDENENKGQSANHQGKTHISPRNSDVPEQHPQSLSEEALPSKPPQNKDPEGPKDDSGPGSLLSVQVRA